MTVHLVCPQGHPVLVAAGKLGSTVACPRCLTTFRAELDDAADDFARNEERKSRPRDDEDDEDEKPAKKSKPGKAKKDDERISEKPIKKKPRKSDEDDDERVSGKPLKKKPRKSDEDEDEKPRKKKAVRKDDDDDDDEDEDEEGDEDEGGAEDEEEPIEWTPRKKRLNMCGNGLMVMLGAYGVLGALTFFLMLVLVFFSWGIGGLISIANNMDGLAPILSDATMWIFVFTTAPFAFLTQVVLLIGLGMSLAVPPKVEGRASVIAGLVFGGLVFLTGIMMLLAYFEIIASDAARAANVISLLGTGAGLCFLICIMSAMAYHGTLLRFLNLRFEASQPLTNTMFYFLYLFAMFVLFAANPYACFYLHPMICYVFMLAIAAVAAMAIRMLVAQIHLFIKSRKAIMQYIRDA